MRLLFDANNNHSVGASAPAAPAPPVGALEHYRFNQGITVTGSGVSQWDGAISGYHLLQGTDTNRPTKNPDGSILFDGVDNFLKASAFTLNQPFTYCLLVKPILWSDALILCDGNGAASAMIWQTGSTPKVGLYAGAAPAGIDLPLGAYSSLFGVFNGASSVIDVDGTTATVNPGAGNAGGFTLGALGSGAGNWSNIEVKDVLIYPTALDATQRLAVRDYWATL